MCSAEAVATENVLEGLLELLTEARVDDGVEAAVEVAQPESNFEDSFRGSVGWEVGAFGDTERMKKKKKKGNYYMLQEISIIHKGHLKTEGQMVLDVSYFQRLCFDFLPFILKAFNPTHK